MKKHAMCRRNGFTLIELPVVIAIIAILAAILFLLFASSAGTGGNGAWQSPVVADLHRDYKLSGLKLVSGANFILSDGYVKYLRVSPENNGVGGAVSLGGPGTCVEPKDLAATKFVATFCRQ